MGWQFFSFMYLLSGSCFLPRNMQSFEFFPCSTCSISFGCYRDFLFIVFMHGFFGYYVFMHGFLWINPIWALIRFLNIKALVFHLIWDIFSHYSKYFSAPHSFFSPSRTPIMLLYLIVSQRSLQFPPFIPLNFISYCNIADLQYCVSIPFFPIRLLSSNTSVQICWLFLAVQICFWGTLLNLFHLL